MKVKITLLLLISSVTLYSQIDQVIGNYYRKLGGGDHIEEYNLTLNQDGTFFFHHYRNLKYNIPRETNKYGKGIWKATVKKNFSIDNIVISFFTEKEKDFDDKYTLDFNNSKARFVVKSPRDKTDKIVVTKLQFFKSEMFWIERIDIIKE